MLSIFLIYHRTEDLGLAFTQNPKFLRLSLRCLLLLLSDAAQTLLITAAEQVEMSALHFPN